MIRRYQISSDAWTAITSAGESGICWLDDDNEESGDAADVRIWHDSTPGDTELGYAKRVIRAKSNNDGMSFVASREEDIYYARCARVGATTVLCVDTDGVGNQRISGDVVIQDSTNPFASGYFTRELDSATIASGGVINTKSVTLNAGHNFADGVAGQVLVVEGYYIGVVLSVAGNVVVVDTPFGYTFPAGTTVKRGDILMNRDGSTAPLVYIFRPVAGRKFDTKEIRISILDASDMGDGLFGGGVARTNGIVLREKKSAAWYNNIANIKTNGDVQLYGYVTYSSKPPAGEYGCMFRIPLQEAYGSIARTIGDQAQEIQIVIQDDCSDLDSMVALATSHLVED